MQKDFVQDVILTFSMTISVGIATHSIWWAIAAGSVGVYLSNIRADITNLRR
jgi:hypothetical protein